MLNFLGIVMSEMRQIELDVPVGRTIVFLYRRLRDRRYNAGPFCLLSRILDLIFLS